MSPGSANYRPGSGPGGGRGGGGERGEGEEEGIQDWIQSVLYRDRLHVASHRGQLTTVHPECGKRGGGTLFLFFSFY